MSFDFDAFIDNTALPMGPVSAYGRDHSKKIAALRKQLDALPVDSDDRESSGASPRAQLEQRIQQLRTEMEESRVEWILRGYTPDEFAEAVERSTKSKKGPDVYEQIAQQSRPPKGHEDSPLYAELPRLTADQWHKIADAIGHPQWSVLVTEANDIIVSKVVLPDFSPTSSPSNSSARSQAGSDAN